MNTIIVQSNEIIINCDHEPCRPLDVGGNGIMKVKEHRKMGKIKFDPLKVELYLTRTQKKGILIKGNMLLEILKSKKIMNANVLDELLVRQYLIPEVWKKDKSEHTRYIFFWGTIYANFQNFLFVRYFYWDNEKWRTNNRWVGDYWDYSNPVALLVD